MAEITYHLDGKSSSVWTDSPNMIDGSIESFASTSGNGDTEDLNSSTCDGTDLGTITKVEIRVYGYGDGNDRIDFVHLPYVYYKTMGTSPDWSSWNDATAWETPWDWTELRDFWVGIKKVNVSKGNVMYCAKVEVRVTYTPYGPPTITTRPVGNERKTTAIGYGSVTATGGKEVTKRGVCWNTTGDPDVNDSKSEETGSFGVGYFSRPMTGLTAGQHYYLKAYAYNSEGYGYGSQVEFDALPTNSEVLFPNAAGDETNIETQYPPDTGSHYDKVDEDSPDDSDTYVRTTGDPYQRDLYNLPASSGSGTIDKIVVHIRCATLGPGQNNHYKASIKSDSTTTDGDEETSSVLDLWEDFSKEWVNNPADSQAWEWSDIDALQIGANIECNWMDGVALCTQVYVVVYYTPTGPPEEVTQYLPGNDCPVFPHEMDVDSDKLPCPPPHD